MMGRGRWVVFPPGPERKTLASGETGHYSPPKKVRRGPKSKWRDADGIEVDGAVLVAEVDALRRHMGLDKAIKALKKADSRSDVNRYEKHNVSVLKRYYTRAKAARKAARG